MLIKDFKQKFFQLNNKQDSLDHDDVESSQFLFQFKSQNIGLTQQNDQNRLDNTLIKEDSPDFRNRM